VLFERSLWDAMGGLHVPRSSDGVGTDEAYLCGKCIDNIASDGVLQDVLAGHFSFGPQEEIMRASLPDLIEGLMIARG